MVSLFTELAVVMVIAFAVAIVMSRLRQPLLIAYILTGVLVGPIFLNVLSQPANYEVFSHIGVALLLFIVGLQLNPKLIKEVGAISLVTGLGQILFTSIFGVLINRLLGFAWVPSILIAVALTFSSTIIIVKLLSDIHGLEQLYGKISLGFLLVQDFVAVLALLIVGSFSSDSASFMHLVPVLLFGIGLTLILFVVGKNVFSHLLDKISLSKELLFLFIIAWCFGISVAFEAIGFSLEIGALIAGVVLASTSYQHDISGRIKPLKDFFIILFFIFLGTQLIPLQTLVAGGDVWVHVVSTLGPLLPKALLLSLFVLIGNPLIVLFLVTRFGYSSKTGFLAGLTVSQISEFSLILVLAAQSANLLTVSHVSLITLVAIITIACSTYLVVYGEKLYARFEQVFIRFQKKHVKDGLHGLQGKKHSIGVFGYGPIGKNILRALKKSSANYLIVDYDPIVVRDLKKKGEQVVFGDISSVEFLSEFDFKDMQFIISTISDYALNKSLLENFKVKNSSGVAVLTADKREDALGLYELGADYVIEPHHLGGLHIEELIKEFSENKKIFSSQRMRHLDEMNRV